jgi:hypothetical protein
VVAGAIIVLTQSGGGGGANSQSNGTTGGFSEVQSASGLRAIRTVNLGGSPKQVVADANGTLVVSLPSRGALETVDPAGSANEVQVGGAPSAIAAGTNGVWVSGSGYGPLALVSPQDGHKLQAVSLSGGNPILLAVDPNDGSVWAADVAGNLTHVSKSGQVMGPPLQVTPPPFDIGWGEGWLWAVNGSDPGLVRVGPPTQTFEAGGMPVSVAFNNGVWTGHAHGVLSRFNPLPDALHVNAKLPVSNPDPLDAVASTEDKTAPIWGISATARALYRIRYVRPAITGAAVFASSPVSLAAAGPSVWVATGDGKLVELTSNG